MKSPKRDSMEACFVSGDLFLLFTDGLFETVVDSHLVGVEKPNPEIFRLALKRMSLRAESTLYIGDLPEVDVKGARSAGLSAVLLDRHDLYLEEAVPRVRHLQDLLALLPAKGSAQN